MERYTRRPFTMESNIERLIEYLHEMQEYEAKLLLRDFLAEYKEYKYQVDGYMF